jgi:hypothetical protein
MPMLSVLLLLLAFFILLVSMVEFDERRTLAALGSLSATFNARSSTTEALGSGAAVGEEGVMHNLAVEVGAVLATLLHDGAFALDTNGAIAVIGIDNAALFERGLQPAAALPTFAERFARTLGDVPRGFHVAIDIVEPLGEAGATRRAGAVARAFEAAGISAAQLMTGLMPAEAGRTRIDIRVLRGESTFGRERARSGTPAP